MTRTTYKAGAIAASVASVLAVSIAAAAAGEREEIASAARWVAPLFGTTCDFSDLLGDGTGDTSESHRYEIRYRYPGQGQDEPDSRKLLYELHCSMGAYNESFLYVEKDPDSGHFRLLSFARPTLDYDYTDDSFSKLRKPPRITGFAADFELVNSGYDPATKTISSGAKWRGLGDAWSSGVWEFVDGDFVMKRYEVDPTYDLNVDKPDTSQPESYLVFDRTAKKTTPKN
jgi:hypothetical protein